MAKRAREDASPSASASEHDGTPPPTPSSSTSPPRPAKYASLDPSPSPSTSTAPPPPTMHCRLPPHPPLNFPTQAAYTAHYTSAHTNRCTACGTNLPSAHLLDLHIAERHDPLTAARRDKGEKTFACFVEGCDKVCADWQKRRSHLVDKHGFPRNYDFFVVYSGVDGRRSLLRAGVDERGHRRRSREGRRGSVGGSSAEVKSEGSVEMESVPSVSSAGDEAERGTGGNGDRGDVAAQASRSKAAAPAVNVDELADSMSSLRMVPRSVTFGRRKGKSGFAKS